MQINFHKSFITESKDIMATFNMQHATAEKTTALNVIDNPNNIKDTENKHQKIINPEIYMPKNALCQ